MGFWHDLHGMEIPFFSGNVSQSSSVPSKPAEPGKGTGNGVKITLAGHYCERQGYMQGSRDGHKAEWEHGAYRTPEEKHWSLSEFPHVMVAKGCAIAAPSIEHIRGGQNAEKNPSRQWIVEGMHYSPPICREKRCWHPSIPDSFLKGSLGTVSSQSQCCHCCHHCQAGSGGCFVPLFPGRIFPASFSGQENWHGRALTDGWANPQLALQLAFRQLNTLPAATLLGRDCAVNISLTAAHGH